MTDWIVGAVLLVIIGGAVVYIIKQKKKGVNCIGCPMARNCMGKCEQKQDSVSS